MKLKHLKLVIFLAALVPLALLGRKAYQGVLGANPIEVITHATGDWILRFLLITLAITPLRKLTRQPWLIRFRRMLGLFAFFYGCLHMVTYIWLDKFFDVGDILKDVAKRPFITAGSLAFLLMVPLAATSTRRAIQRLGRRWEVLHRLVYASATAAVVHFWWKQKADIRQPEIYAAILAGLLFLRVVFAARKARNAQQARSRA